MKRTTQRICVYCGSSSVPDGEFVNAARVLGQTFAAAGITLIYGGASVGTMGVLADAVLENGGEVIGVIPLGLQEREIAHPKLTELHVVESMHERKLKMVELADAFLALPGGLGTLDEMFEVLTWAQLGIHSKPFGLLNVGRYFDKLVGFLDHAVEVGFISGESRALLRVDRDLDRLLESLPLPASR